MKEPTRDSMKTIEIIRQILADRREKEKNIRAAVFDGVPNSDINKIFKSS